MRPPRLPVNRARFQGVAPTRRSNGKTEGVAEEWLAADHPLAANFIFRGHNVGLTIMSSETRLVSVSTSALPFPWSIQCILESFS